jgi:hypothetical protein
MFALKAVPLTLRQVRQLQYAMGAVGASASKATAPQAQLPVNIAFLLRRQRLADLMPTRLVQLPTFQDHALVSSRSGIAIPMQLKNNALEER